MDVIFGGGQSSVTVRGLYQWDFGQEIKIYGVDTKDSEVEIHFAQFGMAGAIRGIGDCADGIITCRIPDNLLVSGEEITVYVYVTGPDYGKTVRTVKLPVVKRKRPENYSGSEFHNALQVVLERLGTKADNLKLLDGILQLYAGENPIGDRVRLPASGGSREIELRSNGVSIQWRYTDSNDWSDLVTLAELKGEKGDPGVTPEFEIREGHLFAIYQE